MVRVDRFINDRPLWTGVGDGVVILSGTGAGREPERQMSQVNNISSTPAVSKLVQNPIQKQIPADAPSPLRATDKLELTGASHLLQMLKSNDVRTDKVASVRSQIEAGTYDADGAKLDGAVSKLLDELNK
jgi:anti-sigma28 factor (negative regulator of flagellin synthesis)